MGLFILAGRAVVIPAAGAIQGEAMA